MRQRVVFLDRATLAASTRLRRPGFQHDWIEYPSTAAEQVVERLSGAQIAIVNKAPLSRASLERLPDLRLVAVAATGTDCIDLGCCRERGVAVVNVRGYAATSVPEHTFALILALRRALFGFRDDLRRGDWLGSGQFCLHAHSLSDLRGSTIGIVGRGTIGEGVALLASAFGMEILYAENKGAASVRFGYTPFDDVLATVDVLTLHCPLVATTRNLIATPEFEAMREDALLINTSRGGLINESDLVAALDRGLIGGAALDSVSVEPMPADHPFRALLDRSNFILTPHVAWASREAMQSCADQLVENIECFVAGAPINLVE